MTNDPFAQINYFFDAIHSNQPKSLSKLVTPNFKIITPTLGDMNLNTLIKFIKLFNYRINYSIDEITKIDQFTYITSGCTELLFPPEDFYTTFHTLSTFKFSNGLIDTSTPIVNMQQSDINTIRKIFLDPINGLMPNN